MEKTKGVLSDAVEKNKDNRNVHHVLLVGGASRIPKISEMLVDRFGKEKMHSWLNPDEAVAKGAAVLAAQLAGADHKTKVILHDVTPLSLGI